MTGESGAGLVKATASAKGELKALDIDPSIFNGDDKEVVEDLILAAIKDAQTKAAEKALSGRDGQADRKHGSAQGHQAAVLRTGKLNAKEGGPSGAAFFFARLIQSPAGTSKNAAPRIAPPGLHRPKPYQRPQMAAGRRQQEGDKGNARILAGKRQCLARDCGAKAKTVRPQHQPEIPLCAFFLEPAPAEVIFPAQESPMAQPVALPAGFLGGHEFPGSGLIPCPCQQRHMLRHTRI